MKRKWLLVKNIFDVVNKTRAKEYKREGGKGQLETGYLLQSGFLILKVFFIIFYLFKEKENRIQEMTYSLFIIFFIYLFIDNSGKKT